MKKYILYIITISLLVSCLSGCKNNDTAQKMDEETFQTKLISQPYETEIMGYTISVTMNPDGTGTASSEGMSYDFDYKISDQKDNSAKITVTGTGIPEIDGESAEISFVNEDLDDLKVSYQGMSYVLKPTSDQD